MSETQTLVDHAPLLERAFNLEFSEQSYRIEGIEGEIPAFVRGTYYVNGPARFRQGDLRYRHWLDGDGQVVSLHFDDDGVQLTNRFVRSRKFVAEQEAGKALFRTFGTSFEGDQLLRGIALETPVNVSVFPFADTLLAFGEQGLPWELDPVTLETRGEYTFGGRLNAISPLSAHPCFAPDSHEMFNFGISFAARQPSLQLYRFAADGELIYRKRFPIDFPCSIHDFILSTNVVVFYLSPYILDVESMMREGKTVMEGLSWQPELGSQLVVVDRETGSKLATIPIGSRYCLHLINSYEEDGRLVVDAVELDQPIYDQYEVIPDLFVDAPEGRPGRYVIDRETWEVVEKHEIDYPVAPDFPSIDTRLATRPNEHFWLLGISKTGQERGRKFFDQLAHLDWSQGGAATDIYHVPEKNYLGCEPVFIANPEDPAAGLILVKHFDAENMTDTYLLFDAFDVKAGPIARLPLREPLPPGFHATFEPANS